MNKTLKRILKVGVPVAVAYEIGQLVGALRTVSQPLRTDENPEYRDGCLVYTDTRYGNEHKATIAFKYPCPEDEIEDGKKICKIAGFLMNGNLVKAIKVVDK